MAELKVPLSELKKLFQKQLSKKQQVFRFRAIAEGIGITVLIGYLFYDSIMAALLISPFIYFYVKERMKGYRKKELEMRAYGFKDGMQSVRNAMQVGYSIENAFREALPELELMYGRNNFTYVEFSKLISKLALNIPVEEAFFAYAKASEVEEIEYFSEVLGYAKRAGGNLAEIIRDTSEIIGDKIDVKREIGVVIAGKKFEQTVMSMIPMGIILYMRLSSFGTMERLYGNAFGVMIMTVCLIIYGFSVLIAQKIIRIPI